MSPSPGDARKAQEVWAAMVQRDVDNRLAELRAVEDDEGYKDCDTAWCKPAVIGGLCFIVLSAILVGSAIVALWRWIA